jgi:DNA-binding helix-hairpin-helix protein with protein kinase domain
MNDLFDSKGRRIPLGKELGTGGEGTVYAVPALSNDVVAKVYHKPLSVEKQAKLQAMVKGCDAPLSKVAAWPVATLHSPLAGAVRGFLMPRATGYEPIHHLYSPAQRKQQFPDIDWAFLVNVARNVAAAFDTIHAHGHIIGDVNPNLVFLRETASSNLSIATHSKYLQTENTICATLRFLTSRPQNSKSRRIFTGSAALRITTTSASHYSSFGS